MWHSSKCLDSTVKYILHLKIKLKSSRDICESLSTNCYSCGCVRNKLDYNDCNRRLPSNILLCFLLFCLYLKEKSQPKTAFKWEEQKKHNVLNVHGRVCVLGHLNHRAEIRFNYTCNNFSVSIGPETIYMLISMTAVMTCNKKTSAAWSNLILEHYRNQPLLFDLKPLVSLVTPCGKCFGI